MELLASLFVALSVTTSAGAGVALVADDAGPLQFEDIGSTLRIRGTLTGLAPGKDVDVRVIGGGVWICDEIGSRGVLSNFFGKLRLTADKVEDPLPFEIISPALRAVDGRCPITRFNDFSFVGGYVIVRQDGEGVLREDFHFEPRTADGSVPPASVKPGPAPDEALGEMIAPAGGDEDAEEAEGSGP